MTQVERVRAICKEKKIPISRLETDLGYGNGTFNPKKSENISSDRVYPIAQYLDVSVEYLLTGEEKSPAGAGQRDELIRLFEAASPELQAAALAVLRSAEAPTTIPGADPTK